MSKAVVCISYEISPIQCFVAATCYIVFVIVSTFLRTIITCFSIIQFPANHYVFLEYPFAISVHLIF